jgi:hypothetical protein
MHNLIMHASRVSPTYTCPTCRATVRARPTEVFTLKAVVSKVAELVGEAPETQDRVGAGLEMWNGFFPPTMV